MMFKIFKAAVDTICAALLVLFLVFIVAVVLSMPAKAQTYIKGPALIEGVTLNGLNAALSNTSQTVQVFNGGPYTATLPSALTIPLGKYYYFTNSSGSGDLIIRDFGANIQTRVPGGYQTYCVLYATGTANGAWNCSNLQINLSNNLLVTGTLPIANGGTGQISFAAGVITSNGTTLTSTSVLPIANGGTSGSTKAAAFDNLSPMTTGGDIIYGGASGTGTRLANGSLDQILSSNGGTNAPSWKGLGSIPGAVTGSTTVSNQGSAGLTTVQAGTYSATVTNSSNTVSITSPVTCNYSRIGSTVSASCPLIFGCTSAGTLSAVLVTLPITTTQFSTLQGTLGMYIQNEQGYVQGVSGPFAQVLYNCGGIPSTERKIVFQYQVP